MKMFEHIKKTSNKKGASLVEVLIAAAIVVLVFAGLLQVFIYSSVLSQMSGNITLAVNEAQSKIEEIRGHDYDTILTDYVVSGTPGNTFTPNLINGTGTVTVSAVNSELINISVTVNWTETGGRTMSTTLATMLAARE